MPCIWAARGAAVVAPLLMMIRMLAVAATHTPTPITIFSWARAYNYIKYAYCLQLLQLG